MTGTVLTFICDLILTGLLGVTILFCGRLNTRIRVLQDSKSELAQLIRQFDESTEKATASILEIQNASKQIGQNIQAKLDKANFLADDLSFMIERGSKLADQMEHNLSAGRGAVRAPVEAGDIGSRSSAASARQAPNASSAPPNAAAVKEKPMPALSAKEKTAAAAGSTAAKTNASLESVLERMSGRGASVEQAGGAKQGIPSVRVRSKAEQELLDALKSGR